MSRNISASRAALAAVLIVAGAVCFWWIKNRPSYVLFQAHEQLGRGNQAAVIKEYQRLLSKPGISLEDQIKYRKALGEFYVRAIQETTSISYYSRDDYAASNPFLAQAKSEFKKVVELAPTDSVSHYYLGRILWYEHLEAYAMEELELSRQYDPKNPQPLYFLAAIHNERGEPAAARELALQALAIYPEYDDARLVLVNSYSLLGDHDNALKEYNRLSEAFKAQPETKAEHALYLATENDWAAAKDSIDEAVNAAPENGLIKMILGRIYLERGQAEEAAGQFSQAAALMPHNIWPVVWQTRAFSLRGQCEDAAGLAQVLVEALPRWSWAHLANAWARLCKGNDTLALNALDEALRITPDFADAIRLKAEILMDKEQFDLLGPLVRRMLDKKTNESLGYALLAESFVRQGNPALGEEMAEAAIKANMRNERALVWLGLARYKLKRSDGVDRAFDSAKLLRPFDSTIEGEWAWSGGRDDVLERLVKDDPRNAELWFLLGDVRRSKGRITGAIEAFQSAVTLRPYMLRAQLGLLSCYYRINDGDKADAAFAQAVQINPKNKEVAVWRARLRK